MRSIRVLDCTLRDGGYCNQWMFGEKNIHKVINGLTDAAIDIIECGFVSDRCQSNKNCTKFSSIEDVSVMIPLERKNTLYVAMINYGEYQIDKIPIHSSNLIDGIRVAFHKRNASSALDMCRKIKEKGYKVFVQAMVTMAYSDNEYLELISEVNEIVPYAFYIVDSFGMMKKRDLIRFFALADNNLNEEIYIGFHSHNNLQLAYSNALALIEMCSGRKIIVDSTVYGMGRGAGNLNTELFIDHMNNDYFYDYDLKPILSIMDEVINGFYQRNPWGYSLPNYLSAIHNLHPNYANYLSDKLTITVDMIDNIFSIMDPIKKVEFDKEYIEQLYLDYMDVNEVREQHLEELKQKLIDKKVLLIAPGKSSMTEKKNILDHASSKDVITISVNFLYPFYSPDFIFVSNNIRYGELSPHERTKCIITSNIDNNDAYLQFRYKSLLNDNEYVRDNAGLMITKLLIQIGVKHIQLAGFDGYSNDFQDNYIEGPRILSIKKERIDSINKGLSEVFKKMSQEVKLEFITKPLHFRI